MEHTGTLPSSAAWAAATAWSDRYDANPAYARTPLDKPTLDRPLLASLSLRAADWPDAVLVYDGAAGLTWAELLQRAERTAAVLARATRDGEPVGVLLPDGLACAAALFAGLIAGRTLILLDTVNPTARNMDILRQGGARHVLTDQPSLPDAPDISPLPVDAPGDTLTWDGSDPLGLDAPAFVVTTSGSTGRPKLLAYSQRGLAHRMQQFGAALGFVPGDRILTASGALASYVGFNYLCTALYAGAVTHLGLVRQLGIRGLFARMQQDRINTFRAPPSLMRTLATAPGAAQAFALVKKLRLSSEASTWDDIASMRAVLPAGCRITNSYGSTEAGSFSWIVSDHPMVDATRVLAGVPQAGMEAVIARDDGSPADPEEPGELFIRTRYCTLGDYEAGRVVPGRLCPDPSDPTLGIYPTGDLARMTPYGIFVVLGRRDRMLKINGLRVEPMEIEAVLRAAPSVRDAAVLPRTQGQVTTLIGFAAADRSATTPEALRGHLLSRLPSFMVPARVIVLDALPTLPSGKVDGMALLALVEASGG